MLLLYAGFFIFSTQREIRAVEIGRMLVLYAAWPVTLVVVVFIALRTLAARK